MIKDEFVKKKTNTVWGKSNLWIKILCVKHGKKRPKL